MASEGLSNGELCSECGKQVDIYNEDFQFSLELHLQSHKPLETINQEIEMEIRRNARLQSINSNLNDAACLESNETVFDNYMPLTLDQHSVKDSPSSLNIEPGGQSKVLKRKKKKKLIDLEANLKFLPIYAGDIVSDIFSTLPLELKAHEGFITENKKGNNILCNICNVTVTPIASVTEHIKTRLHEDRTIKYFTGTLSNEFQHIMEFVSFNNSNLCCNLCSFNFFLSPNNHKETIFSIMKHNLSKEHLRKTTRNVTNCSVSDEAHAIFNSLCQLNQTINDNKDCLEFKIQPEFKCKICNVVLGNNLNETSLCKSFIDHFKSEGHLKSKAPSELNNVLNISAKHKHQFVIGKDNIYCSVCNCYVEPNVEAINCHVREMLSSEIPQTVSSGKDIQAQSFITAIEKTQIKTNKLKNSDDPSTSSQGNQSENPVNVLSNLPQHLNSTHSVVRSSVQAVLNHENQPPDNSDYFLLFLCAICALWWFGNFK